MGHHYSGAVVGTAFGSKSITLRKGLLVSGLLVILGAALSNVVQTYANLAKVGGEYSVVVLISFILMSNVTTFLKIPTSTIQLYTFGILGAALRVGDGNQLPDAGDHRCLLGDCAYPRLCYGPGHLPVHPPDGAPAVPHNRGHGVLCVGPWPQRREQRRHQPGKSRESPSSPQSWPAGWR